MKALFVIDVQKATIGKTHDKFFKYDEELINRINKSIEENETVIYIRNLMKNSEFKKTFLERLSYNLKIVNNEEIY